LPPALAAATAYAAALRETEALFATRTGLGEHALPLLEFLRTPLRASPHSLLGQLEYVRLAWAPGSASWSRACRSRSTCARRRRAGSPRAGGGPRRPHPDQRGGFPDLVSLEGETERFSPDAEWMPRSVMIAKSTLVWLDQLSRRHGRAITPAGPVPTRSSTGSPRSASTRCG
jgi:hypothetical protein